MRTLIAYYSLTQSNENLALRLQKKIGCDILKIEEHGKRTTLTILLDLLFNRKPAIKTKPCSVKVYDRVILIAPIWAAKIASPLRSFIEQEKVNIGRYSFLAFCGGADGQREKIVRELVELVGKKPACVFELWLKDLPLPREKKDSIKWNKGYIMDDRDFKFFEPKIDAFINASGVRISSGLEEEMHEPSY